MNLIKWAWKPRKKQWDLRVAGRGCPAATVYPNGVWHTWDHHGVGGENSSEDTVNRAMREAAGAAIAQGFI
jgi:hypothetical protein